MSGSKLYRQPTYLLLDECHRWSKTQSDSLLRGGERDHPFYRLHNGKTR